MHVPINVKSPNNISKWQMGFNSAFKGLIQTVNDDLLITMMQMSEWPSLNFKWLPTIMNGVEFRVTRCYVAQTWLILCNWFCSPFVSQRSRVTPDKRKWKSKG